MYLPETFQAPSTWYAEVADANIQLSGILSMSTVVSVVVVTALFVVAFVVVVVTAVVVVVVAGGAGFCVLVVSKVRLFSSMECFKSNIPTNISTIIVAIRLLFHQNIYRHSKRLVAYQKFKNSTFPSGKVYFVLKTPLK